jgi:hypothetical protein
MVPRRAIEHVLETALDGFNPGALSKRLDQG